MNIETGEFRAIIRASAEVGYDQGRDAFAYEIGDEICARTREGSTDTEILDATREIVSARMEVGLPSAAWFAS